MYLCKWCVNVINCYVCIYTSNWYILHCLIIYWNILELLKIFPGVLKSVLDILLPLLLLNYNELNNRKIEQASVHFSLMHWACLSSFVFFQVLKFSLHLLLVSSFKVQCLSFSVQRQIKEKVFRALVISMFSGV